MSPSLRIRVKNANLGIAICRANETPHTTMHKSSIYIVCWNKSESTRRKYTLEYVCLHRLPSLRKLKSSCVGICPLPDLISFHDKIDYTALIAIFCKGLSEALNLTKSVSTSDMNVSVVDLITRTKFCGRVGGGIRYRYCSPSVR